MTSKVCIIGLGYVGVPLLHALLEQTSFVIHGFDVSSSKIDGLNSALLPESLSKYKSIFDYGDRVTFSTAIPTNTKFDVFIVCVPTPITLEGVPDLTFVESAFSAISRVDYANSIISLESTVYPGATREIGSQYLNLDNCILCFSPEREDPGNPNFTISSIPKLISSHNSSHLPLVQAFYSSFVNDVVPVSSLEIAELSKLLENTQRSVNISLMNELKQYVSLLDVDIFEVVRAASTKPFGFTPYYPGPGIGGHCIPVDPTYLSWAAKKLGHTLNFVEQSSQVNAELPRFVKSTILEKLALSKLLPSELHACFVGLAYKKNIEDTRSSPSSIIINELKHLFSSYSILDPFVSDAFSTVEQVIDNSDSRKIISIILTDHDSIDYHSLELNSFLIFDSRGRFSTSNTIFRI